MGTIQWSSLSSFCIILQNLFNLIIHRIKLIFYLFSIWNYSIITYVLYNYHKYKRRIIKIETYTDEEFNSLVTDLVQAIRKQKLVIFIGAGVSISQGYPNWNDYVSHLIKYWQSYLLSISPNVNLGREKFLVFDTIAKSKLSNKRKVDLVNHSLKSILGEEEFKKNRLNFEKNYFEKLVPYQPSNEILEALVNIDAIFVTPNYDLEIEKHAQRLRNSVKSINDLQEFVINNDSKLEWGDILHIHGTPHCNPDFFVSSSADYSKTYLREKHNFEQLKKWFSTKNLTVLFVGVSLEEDEILSVLAPENKHYALMKADETMDPEVDKEYRNLYSTFFKNENHTSIIWYGNSFDDLPKFIKKLTVKINEETGLSPQNREWQLLLNPTSTEDEVINALNNNADNGTFLNALYNKILTLNDKELSEHILHSTFKSSVVKNTIINNFESFWNFVDQNKESLSPKEWEIIRELFSKGNQNYYINSLYNLYKYGIDYQKILNDELSNIRSAISSTTNLPLTSFINDCDLMGYWFIKQFEILKNQKNFYGKSIYLTNDTKEKLKINLDDSQINELANAAELTHEIIPYSIEELISEGGILEILYVLLSKNHISINKKSLLEKIPEELISRKVIQKILVKLDNDISLESNLVEKLINNINFNDKTFGSELNSFVERHSLELKKHQIVPHNNYHDLITRGASFIVQNNSFITVEQILNLSEQELLHILLTSQENQFNLEKPWEENTVDATIDFCIELLTNDSNKELQEKLWTFLSKNSKKLFNRYSSLFYKLATIEELPKNIVNFSINTCLENMNDNHFLRDKEKFFKYFVQQDNVNTQIIDKLFSISPSNLDSSLSDNKDFDMMLFINSELGGYLSTLIELAIKHKEYITGIKEIIDNLSHDPYKQFMKGVFLYDYDINIEVVSYETFLGYIYYHNGMLDNTKKLFAELVSNLLKTKINDNKALNYALLIALEYIEPKEIMFQHNNFNYMVNLIFLSQEKFRYENDWLRQLILQENKNYNILSSLAFIIQKDRLNNDKYLEFLDTFKDNVTECTANIELYSLTYYLSEEKTNEKKNNLLIKYIWILLENRKIKKSFQDLESLFVLLPYLDDKQLINLKESQYIQELLSPPEWEELKRKIGNYTK